MTSRHGSAMPGPARWTQGTTPAGRARPARSARLVRLVLAGLLALGSTTVAACSSDPNSVAEQAKRGSDQGFIAGDGTIEQVSVSQRGAPLEVRGTLLDGKPWQMSQVSGKVVVINVWGSWCQPCLAEAPHLVAAAKQLTTAHRDVSFLGIDVGEGPQTGAAGATALGLPYPSLSDPDRSLGPALQNKANATPTTLVIDRQGRIAARISGEITSPKTLVDLVETVVTERG